MSGNAETYIFGGEDHRSNPLNGRADRSLRCLNYVPIDGGFLELRRGFTPLDMSSVVSSPIHSIVAYELWNGGRFILFGQGAVVYKLALATGIVTTVGTLGTSNKWNTFYTNNQLHFGDGDQVWFYDGIKLRKNGLRALTTLEAGACTVSLGTRGPSSGEASAVTVTASASGGTLLSVGSGYQAYMFYYDKSTRQYGPAVKIGGRVPTTGSTSKLQVAVLPNLSGVNANFVKLFGLASWGSDVAWLNLKNYWSGLVATFSSGFITATKTGHGLTAGDPVVLWFSSSLDPNFSKRGIYPVNNVIDANNFRIAVPSWSGSQPVDIGQLFFSANAGTTLDITSLYAFTALVGDIAKMQGIPASTVGTTTPGYQFYISIYNPTTSHVGNRVAVGARIVPTGPVSAVLGGLPDLSLENTELEKLVEVTIDGGETPYVLQDGDGNWVSVPNADTSISLNGSYEPDFESEGPARNGLPAKMNKFCVMGDQVFGCTPTDPFVYVSGSQGDPNNPVVGRPEQSWSPTDILTFPTRQVPTCIQTEVVFSRTHLVRFARNLAGVWDWVDDVPFPIGCPGQRAFANTIHGRLWFTGQKQLAGFTEFGPVVVSDEYEAGLLSKFGDQYLSEVELIPIVDIAKRRDVLVIKGKKEDGSPHVVIYDFRLGGQAYEWSYGGDLSNDFSVASVYDNNGILMPVAGGSEGRIFRLDDSYSDLSFLGNDFVLPAMNSVSVPPYTPSISNGTYYAKIAPLTEGGLVASVSSESSPFVVSANFIHTLDVLSSDYPFGLRLYIGNTPGGENLFRDLTAQDIEDVGVAIEVGDYSTGSPPVSAPIEFSADYIALVNFGPDRPSVSGWTLYGDSNHRFSVLRELSGDPSLFQDLDATPEAGEPDSNFKMRHNMQGNAEMQMTYIRLQLDSHSADAPTEEQDVIHCPLESYGRIYIARGEFGAARGS